MKFVHGTSDIFVDKIMTEGLQPPDVTTNLTEKRDRRLDDVHILDEAHSRLAGAYALRAVRHFGGEPIVILGEVPDIAIKETLPGKAGFPDIHVVPYLPAIHINTIEKLDGEHDSLDISSMFKSHKS